MCSSIEISQEKYAHSLGFSVDSEQVWVTIEKDRCFSVQVSNLGLVRQVFNGLTEFGPAIKTTYPNFFISKGRLYYRKYSTPKSYRSISIADLVASAFCNNPNHIQRASFRNGNQLDCRVKNLYFRHPSGVRLVKGGEFKQTSLGKNKKPVCMYAINEYGTVLRYLATFASVREAALILDIPKSTISKHLHSYNHYNKTWLRSLSCYVIFRDASLIQHPTDIREAL